MQDLTKQCRDCGEPIHNAHGLTVRCWKCRDARQKAYVKNWKLEHIDDVRRHNREHAKRKRDANRV